MPDSSLEIRGLTLADVLPVMRVCNQAFLEHARFPRMGANVIRYVREWPEWQWGALDGERLAGFLLTEPRDGKARVAIRLIATDPAVGRRGVGRSLVAELEKKAGEEGVPLLSVGTPFAGGFYEKCGFAVTRVSLKVIREIIQKPAPRPEGVEIGALDYDSAAEVLELLEGDDERAKFLGAFCANYREHRGLALRVSRGGRALGVAVGRVSDFYRDFAEIAFWRAFDGDLGTLLRAFEYVASTMGLREVGLAADADREGELAELGYARSDRDYYWTMLTLEKPLKT
jgi:ribosomal protein S18 acetylase RimI-like enzyme